MPAKPKTEKHVFFVVVNAQPISVVLHPPTGRRKCWYAYWKGLMTSKSTGQAKLDAAIVAAESMVRNNGRLVGINDAVLSDEEFEQIQKAHFAKKNDPAARTRAAKSLEDCLDAIAAFRDITGLKTTGSATPEDCEQFQKKAVELPKNWRRKCRKKRKPVEPLSANTILKMSRTLQAAFERANRNAGRKCVRGVVENAKLLESNPWNKFTWIEGKKPTLRQLDDDELVSLMTFLQTCWGHVPLAAVAAKVFLWSGCRKLEVAALRWDQVRAVGNEYHFEVIGKWGVEKWFRIPQTVYEELRIFQTSRSFVFNAYTEQIRNAHHDNPGCLRTEVLQTQLLSSCLRIVSNV